MFRLGKEERIWKEFMDEQKSEEELCQVLTNSEIDDFFRDRVIKILMTYDFASLPFKVNVSVGMNNMLSVLDVSKFPEDKVDVVAILLTRNIREIKGAKKYIGARGKYNQVILDLLPRLDSDRRCEVFDYFDIRDIDSYFDMDSCSGYGPLRSLLHTKNIDNYFRDLAIEKMHKVILSEFNKKSVPREDYEDAFTSYRSILNLILYGKNMEIDQAFFEKEIYFLLSIGNGEAVAEYSLQEMLSKIMSKETRRALIERQLNCGGHYQFYIHGLETELLAERIRDEFPEFSDKITILMKAYYERLEKDKEAIREASKKKKSMFDSMKKS